MHTNNEEKIIVIDLNKLVALGDDEIFTFQDPENGRVLYFNSTKLRAHVEKFPGSRKYINIPIFEHDIHHAKNHCGVEEAKITRLMERPDIFAQPCLVIAYDDGIHHIKIDGNHRTVILYQMGLRKMGAYLVKPEVWKDFLVDLPSDPEFIKYALGR